MPKFTLLLQVFFFKVPEQLWNCAPDISVQNTAQRSPDNILIDSHHAIKKVSDLAEE